MEKIQYILYFKSLSSSFLSVSGQPPTSTSAIPGYSLRNAHGGGGPLPGGRGSTPNISPTHSLRTLGGSSGVLEDSDSDDDDQAQPRGLTGIIMTVAKFWVAFLSL